MKKSFIITVDTEPDGQWDLNASLTTRNAQYIPRFQELCCAYGFKPVYLTDYVMLSDSGFVDNIGKWASDGKCEIGMHLHAWDTPPFVLMDKEKCGRPFLIEYSLDDMEQKIDTISNKLRKTFSGEIISHRAGRWALDKRYIKLLSKYGYRVDCSVTPHIDWSRTKGCGIHSKGSDYRNNDEKCHYLDSKLLEVPVTIRKIKKADAIKACGTNKKQAIKALFKDSYYWFRPALFSADQMKVLYDYTKDDDYIEMMIHSSELMPGGSPYFTTEESIDQLYYTMETLFKLVSQTHGGCTLGEYLKSHL